MLENMKNEFDNTTTTNGDKAFISTNSKVLDLFSRGGAMRHAGDKEIETLVSKSFSEDNLLTLKALFYLRDVRKGQGERNLFRVGIKHIAKFSPESVKKNIHLFSEFGRWDDILVLLDTPVKKDVIGLIYGQLTEDLMSVDRGEAPSLLAKWLPSANASSNKTKKLASVIQRGLGLSPKEYRKTLSLLRKEIGILETKITEKNYEDIEYDKIPSVAGLKYRQAFYRNDFEQYSEFLESLSKGEKKVNAGALYPYDIVSKIMQSEDYWFVDSGLDSREEERKLYEGMWNNLPNFIEEDENSLVMADVSGSMYGRPIEVSISLAMYIAERNKGRFHNHFMTFSSEPALVEIVGEDIIEKVDNISEAEWGMSTDLYKALKKVLDIAVEDNLPQSELPSKLYIISDMQFDFAVDRKETVFQSAKKKYKEAGYELPTIVFWNVNGSSNSPATKNEYGVTLVSGCSPSILSFALNCDKFTPYDFMLEVLESERYNGITV